MCICNVLHVYIYKFNHCICSLFLAQDLQAIASVIFLCTMTSAEWQFFSVREGPFTTITKWWFVLDRDWQEDRVFLFDKVWMDDDETHWLMLNCMTKNPNTGWWSFCRLTASRCNVCLEAVHPAPPNWSINWCQCLD